MENDDKLDIGDIKEPEDFFNLGLRLGQKGDFNGAIEAFNNGLKIKPDDVVAWINLGVAHGQNGSSELEALLLPLIHCLIIFFMTSRLST